MTYFEWLEHQVTYFCAPSTNHNLLRKLHSLTYVPFIDRDKNRAIDGINIRNEYFGEYGQDSTIIDTPCSFLEFLIALARRMDYIYGDVHEDRTRDCFWTLLRNMGVIELDDSVDEEYLNQMVEEAVDRVINRTFETNGEGSLFPLQNPREDQRNVEVWYQMNQYLAEAMEAEGR